MSSGPTVSQAEDMAGPLDVAIANAMATYYHIYIYICIIYIYILYDRYTIYIHDIQ